MKTNLCTSVIILLLLMITVACVDSPPPTPTLLPTNTSQPSPTNPPSTATIVPTVQSTTPTTTPQASSADVYRIAFHDEPWDFNLWKALGTTQWRDRGNEVARFFLEDTVLRLYTVAQPSQAFVPQLAIDMPPALVPKANGTYMLTIEMFDAALWSDGVAISAEDIAFTLNTCRSLALMGQWRTYCQHGLLQRVEALDATTVRYFFTRKPTMGELHYGVLQAPILPQHHWSAIATEAIASLPEHDPPTHCNSVEEDYDEALCQLYDETWKILYDTTVEHPPSAGAFINQTWQHGKPIERTRNENYFFDRVEITHFADGTYRETFPNGFTRQFYGDGSGDVIRRYSLHSPTTTILATHYSEKEEAYQILGSGEAEYVLDPGNPLVWGVTLPENLKQIVNLQNGVMYMGFNLRREPFNDPVFRTALDVLIDKKFLTDEILKATVVSTDSIVPPDNHFWHYAPERIPLAGTMYTDGTQVFDASRIPSNDQLLSVRYSWVGMNREERVEVAKTMLKRAGYSWDVEPGWNSAEATVSMGEGFRLPSGKLMPTAEIDTCGPSFYPARASFNQWSSHWFLDLGIPFESTLLGHYCNDRETFFREDFDMYILGWTLDSFPDDLCEFFASENDTFVAGGYNKTGYSNPQFDALCKRLDETFDVEEAQTLIQQMQVLLSADLPYINLFHRQIVDVVAPNVEFPFTTVLGGFAEVNGFQTEAVVNDR